MTSSIKHSIVLVILIATLSSCNQNPSLQTYFVDNQERTNFISMDVPLTMLNIDKNTLSSDQQEAYNSVEKLNVLAYKSDSLSTDDFEAELAKVTTILKDQKYNELMRGGNPEDGKFTIKYVGEDDDIDEFIVLGSSNTMGFAVVRILGNDMDPNKLMMLSSVLQKGDFKDAKIEEVMNFFK